MKTKIETLTRQNFINFYNSIATEIGTNEHDWHILDHLWTTLVEIERKLDNAGYNHNTIFIDYDDNEMTLTYNVGSDGIEIYSGILHIGGSNIDLSDEFLDNNYDKLSDCINDKINTNA